MHICCKSESRKNLWEKHFFSEMFLAGITTQRQVQKGTCFQTFSKQKFCSEIIEKWWKIKKKKRQRKEKMDIQICCALKILSENHKLVISAALRVCPERIKQIYFNESCTSFWIFQHVGLMDEGRSFLDVQWCNPINHQTSQSRQRTLSAFNLWRSNLHFHLMENLIYQERFHSLLQCDCQDKPGALPYLCSRLFR